MHSWHCPFITLVWVYNALSSYAHDVRSCHMTSSHLNGIPINVKCKNTPNKQLGQGIKRRIFQYRIIIVHPMMQQWHHYIRNHYIMLIMQVKHDMKETTRAFLWNMSGRMIIMWIPFIELRYHTFKRMSVNQHDWWICGSINQLLHCIHECLFCLLFWRGVIKK